ncbi:PREDICTED: uncharacterized protein LOC104593088 isoform X2 [Nelumbo nucifera]|uniref:Uncharacterized protein LOC104593088 isoform X2 n=1 Tax=Nelumbo nucifera TaxID=4432 RepID=A0A1U7ZE26_NELNU|nr:PREDICTED: uncharacterized protein LOC104593088 isoform X2 [Nelumbo nucifera]
MDALQQSHRFMRPPTVGAPPSPFTPQSSMADLQPRPSPPQGLWYSGQFQYQSSQPPPLPPYHHQQQTPQWPPHSDHHQIYPTPHHNSVPPYPGQPQHNQYPLPPRPHLPPPPPPHYHHSLHPQGYAQSNQTWGNPNWAHHQSWEYSDGNISHNNEEDWAARARAWAAAKAAMENQQNQQPQLQLPPVGKSEDPSNMYHDQQHQNVDPHSTDIQQPSLLSSGHQQFSVSATNLHRPPLDHFQESSPFSSRQSSSYVSDGHIPFMSREGALVEGSTPVFPHQGSVPTSSSIYQQEVPSSYSSISGKEVGNPNSQLHKPPLPISSCEEGHHVQSTLPTVGRSISAEQPPFVHGDQSAESTAVLSDRPLEFTPRFNHEHDVYSQRTYIHPDPSGAVGSVDSIAAVPSAHAWNPSVPLGAVYPPIPPVPAGPQFDPSLVASPVSGHAAPIFGRMPGSGFRPTIPMASAPFGMAAGTAVIPPTTFPGDMNGGLNVLERPKKASVPNWLREEIIKKKAAIASSVQEQPEEDPFRPVGDEGVDKPFRKDDQADSKSIDSSRSTEDDDEDDVEAARTAAINQEIKRILTEVLLKVTDDLFDEIATEVLTEDDLTVEVHNNSDAPNQKALPSPPVVVTPKASAKVLIPVKAKEAESSEVSGKSSSSSPGDVLGLANYASDEDNDEIQSSTIPNRLTDALHQQSTNGKLVEDMPDAVGNGGSLAETERSSGTRVDMEPDHLKTGPNGDSFKYVVDNCLGVNGLHKDMDYGSDGHPTTAPSVVSGILEDKINTNGEKMLQTSNAFESKGTGGGKYHMKPDLVHASVSIKNSLKDASHGREAGSKSDKNDGSGTRSSGSKDFAREAESSKSKTSEKHSNSTDHRRRDERHPKKEKMDDRNASKERMKDRGIKSEKKVKESDFRKISTHVNSKDEREEVEKDKRFSVKEDSNRKRELAKDDRGDRLRHKAAREDLHRHKRRHTSSISTRGRDSRENTVGSHSSDSSDDVSEDSKHQRNPHSKRRSSSPSPIRSKRRQVSRSPHSKHSQRRHSPYSSLETTRYVRGSMLLRLFKKKVMRHIHAS